VAIAKVNGCKRLYSDDADVIKFGEKAGLEVFSTWGLPLPLAKQINMDYETAPSERQIILEDEVNEVGTGKASGANKDSV
jgi:hypothetical protein